MKSKFINGVKRIKKKSCEGCFALVDEKVESLSVNSKLECLLKYKFSYIPGSGMSSYVKYKPDEICPKPKTCYEYIIERNSSEAKK